MSLSVSGEKFLDDAAFSRLKKVMHEGTNINFDCYRESYLKRRIKVRLTATKTNTYSNYIQYLKANPNEYDFLINDLTVNYTKFFRDNDVYSFLNETLLPELLSSRRWVRIWSAGCATGEEPYSLAILVHQVMKKQLNNGRVTIYASDLDRTALEKAKSGEYTRRVVEGIEESMLDRYFDFDNEVYRVKNDVKQLIHFEEHDLMATPPHNNLDLILCRNVMIYFSREIQQKIHMNFHDSLKRGGYLITGKTEFLGREASQKFVDVDPKCRVYKKA
jgi:chemotaxis protein methyltransferase CheR